MIVPAWLLVHTVVVEPLAGQGPYGPDYGEPVEVPVNLSQKRRLVRSEDGREVVSEATAVTDPAWFELCPEGSLITLPDTGRQTVILSARLHTDAGMGAWQHCEVVLA